MSINSLKNAIIKPTTNLMNKTKNLGSNLMNPNKNKNIGNKIKNGLNPIKNGISSITNSAKEKIENVGKKINEAIPTGEDKSQIPISKVGQMTIEFLNANTAISKFVSFILFLLLFVILFQIGTGILQRFMGPKPNPYIINGMVQSDSLTLISTNPNIANSIPIYRSVDENQGLEFTWNVWFFIDGETKTSNLFNIETAVSNPTNGYRIFSKGPSGTKVMTGANNTNNDNINICPGLFLKKNGNDVKLNIVINTFIDEKNTPTTFFETITVEHIPIQKWVCCTIRAQGKSIDIYMNGMLKNRRNLKNLPKQNYYDTYIGDINGFKGYISSLRYYSYAISYDEVQSLFASGPSLKMISNSSFPASSDYLSINWFFN